MKKIVAMMLAAAALLFVACDSAPKGPEAVAKKAISAIQKGDYEAYAATYDLSKEDQKMLASMMEEKAGKKFEGNGGIDSYEIVESNIDEENGKAKVTIHFVYKDGSSEDESMSFKLVDGDWKQDLKK